ncbi:MAG: carbohydrate ABC transporter permease [candidate division KSB1 bacterium]|nr:carbohydrate ABC transporter permease [candidate division KSB1 bacterium]
MRKSSSPVRAQLPLHLVLCCALALTFLPFAVMALTSLKSIPQFYRNFWGVSTPLHWHNYTEAWQNVRPYLANSVLVSGASVAGVLVLACLTAYVFARFTFPGKKTLFLVLLAVLMVPGVLTLVPAFMVVRQLGLLNSHWALILPYVSGGQVFAIFLLRTCFEAIPRDLFDAATVDGSSELRILWHVVLPLSRPMLGVVAIMNLLWTWNEFMWPFVTLNDARKFVLPVGLLAYNTSLYGSQYPVLFAGYIIASLPLLVLFALTTKAFMKGMTSGALKC